MTYPYSSYAYYVSGKEHPLLDKSRVLGNFRTEQEEKYRMFVECIDGFEIEVEATTIRGQQQMISIIGYRIGGSGCQRSRGTDAGGIGIL